MDHQISENKLILLYIIHEKENIKASELNDFVLFHGYMEYFTLQNALADLEMTSLIVKLTQEGDVYYTSLPEGDTIIEMFRTRIDHSIREEIRDYASHSGIVESPLVGPSVEILKKEDHYEVYCRVLDYDRVVMEFIKSAASEEMANHIRNTWFQKGMSLYRNITKELN